MDLSGQTAIVTGASRGIGKAIAAGLAERGANVALWSRDEEAVAAAADGLAPQAGVTVVARAVDVRDRDAVRHAVTETSAELGPVTLLVNNAGTAGPAGLDWEVDADAWWECVETSVWGSFVCERSVLPGMLERGAGRIVETVSITGTRPYPLLGATGVAKAALIRHAENLAEATAGTGVSVFAVHPGTVQTELLASYRADARMAAFFDRLPEEAYTPPEVAADVVARIASGELDAFSGCFLDATSDIERLRAAEGADATEGLKLRLGD